MLDPLQDGKSRIELIDYMGNDLSIVNDARASFNKISTEFGDRDAKLIKYLIDHEHWSPFRGVVFKFRVRCPLFLCRQWWKHVISSNHTTEQLGWNEMSMRYIEVSDDNAFYIPPQFRQQSKSNKQATCGTLDESRNKQAIAIYNQACQSSFAAYAQLIQLGVGREQARGVLNPAVYTNFVWTVSLQAVLNFISLRKGEGAQNEIALYAEAIEKLIGEIVPEAITAWSRSAS